MSNEKNEIYDQFVEALISGDKKTCSQIFKEAIDGESHLVEDAYEQLIRPAMYEVGRLWEQNEISVAEEHLATAIVESLLQMSYEKVFSSEKIGKSIVIACVPDEHHQVGPRMIADIFELAGWDSYYLGANVPLEELLNFVDEKKPDAVGLSVSLFFNSDSLDTTLESLVQKFPDLEILVGGQGLKNAQEQFSQKYPKVTFISGYLEVKSFLSDMEKAA